MPPILERNLCTIIRQLGGGKIYLPPIFGSVYKTNGLKSNHLQGGPLLVINGVITLINGLIIG